jgi:hypothetical protein
VPVTAPGRPLRFARALTPAGTGHARGRFLQAGDLIEASIGDLGQQRNRCVASQDAS